VPNKQISAFDPPPHTPKTAFYTVCKCLGCSWLLFAAKRVILSGRERTSVTAENKKRQAFEHTAPVSRLALSRPQALLVTVQVVLLKKNPQAPKTLLGDQNLIDP